MKPYEADAARVRAMYRLLAPPSGGRTMEVCFGAPAILADADWRGEHVAAVLRAPTQGPADAAGAGTRFAAGQWQWQMPVGADFDLVVLHRTLDRLASAHASARETAALETLFRSLSKLVTPGGILVVTVANRTWLSRWRKPRLTRASSGTGDGGARLSWRRLRRLFAAGGFVQVQSYNVLPDADAPLRLVHTDADLSRVGFRRELAFMQSSLPLGSYLLRRAVAELALNREIEDWLLTWGARP